MSTLKVSKDFTTYPGARYISDGPFSGEAFFNELLKDKFKEVLIANEILTVDLDYTAGYASSFLSESFGRLAQEFGVEKVSKHLKIISRQEPDWKDRILNDYIPNASNRQAQVLANA
jgi:hypothetical protein